MSNMEKFGCWQVAVAWDVAKCKVNLKEREGFLNPSSLCCFDALEAPSSIKFSKELKGLHVSGLVGTPDTISETGSMKSRSRRTLPYLPPEEPAPLPTQAKKAQERMRFEF